MTLPGNGGARIVLCVEGVGALRASSGSLKVAKGESCYLSAADGAVTASGPAALFIAGSGLDSGEFLAARAVHFCARLKMHLHVQMGIAFRRAN